MLAVARHADVAFEQAAIGMALVDFQGAFLAVNAAFSELVRRSEQELLALTWQTITHAEDIHRGEEEVQRVAAGEEDTFRFAKRYVRSDGNVIWVLLNVSLIRDEAGGPVCLFTQVVDITEQRRAEEELTRLASIVEYSDDAIVSTDADGTVLTWNRAAEQMYGYSEAEMVGRSMATVLPRERHEEARQLIERVRSGERVRNFETVRRHRNGSIIDVSVTVSPIFDASGTLRISSIARDITEQKRITAVLDRTLAALETALQEARDREARSRRFLSDAAHHLRNPVAGINGCVEAFLRGASADDQERLIGEIARETWRTSRLVDRLLRIARLEQGEPLIVERRDLTGVIRDEVERAGSLAPHLTISVVAPGPVWAELDARATREILGNLLENARRHAVRDVRVAVEEDEGFVAVCVADDGPGLPEGEEDQAFEPFMSLDGAGGFGLGLTVSRALARALGGDLAYEDGAFVLRLGRSPLVTT